MTRYWGSLRRFERLTVVVTAGLFLFSFSLSLLRIEIFPFSNYRMFSHIQPHHRRLTLFVTDTAGRRAPISPDIIRPIGRLHLSYLLNHFVNGNPMARQSVHALLDGLFLKNQEISKIEVVIIQVDRATDASRTYDYKIVSTVTAFDRAVRP